jgi:hypothetical protein
MARRSHAADRGRQRTARAVDGRRGVGVHYDPPVDTLTRVLARGSRSNQLLRAGLVAFAVPFFLYSDVIHLLGYTVGVDLEIPLRAAERWMAGGQPYLASSFSTDGGVGAPFLYPPYVLPFLGLLLLVPRAILTFLWLALCAACLGVVLRRLRMPVMLWPLVVIWPPALEGLIGGNPQLPVLALFATALWVPSPHSTPDRAFSRRFSGRGSGLVGASTAAAASVAIKVSHPHVWLYVLRRRPREALLGAIVVVGIIGLTVPLTGLSLWGDWLTQIRLAADPAWPLGGLAVSRFVSVVFGAAVVLLLIVAVISVVPTHHAGAWIGIVTVVGAPSLHNFGMLFLLPAMVLIRAEIAIFAAILMATTTYQGTWVGIIVVAITMLASRRNAGLLEQPPSPDDSRSSGSRSGSADTDRDEDEADGDPEQREDRDGQGRDDEGRRDAPPDRAA